MASAVWCGDRTLEWRGSYREPLLRKTVTLPTSYVDQLAVLGHGNLSDSIRFLLECAYTSAGVRLDPPTLAP